MNEEKGKVRFVLPVDSGAGDGEGVVLERRDDILTIDTGSKTIEIPLKLVFDGFEFVPPPPIKVTYTSKILGWLKNNAAGTVGIALGLAATYFLFLGLPFESSKTLTDQVVRSDQLTQFFSRVLGPFGLIANIVGTVSVLFGISRILIDNSTGSEMNQGNFFYISGGIFIILSSTILKLLFGF